MNKIRIIFICSALVLSCTNDKEAFSKGEKVESKNFSGEVWVNFLVEKDSIHDVSIGSVTFAPGAKTNWHYHPGGQILLVTKGEVYTKRGTVRFAK
jgi:quercetin dioxygenase-like cupin family protein